MSYRYERPLVSDEHGEERRSSTGTSRARKYFRLAQSFWDRAGTTNMRITLGEIGGCERYQLEAEAPFDTWFARANITRGDVSEGASETVDTSQVYRLTYTRTARAAVWSPVLRIDLRSVFTGVARTSVYASAFLAACCVFGTIRVLFASNHAFLDSNTDAGASVLLLFPGIAASLLAVPARHTLTATVQFPPALYAVVHVLGELRPRRRDRRAAVRPRQHASLGSRVRVDLPWSLRIATPRQGDGGR